MPSQAIGKHTHPSVKHLRKQPLTGTDPQTGGGTFVQDKVSQFYQTEKDIVRQSYENEECFAWPETLIERICLPSGREDAELVLILHCQTGDAQGTTHQPSPFWDETSFTIKALNNKKGLHPDFFFGYDWHWRGERSCIGRGKCHATSWPGALKDLNDGFSCYLLNVLPAPFVLIGGTCPRESLRITMKPFHGIRLLSLSVPFCPSTGLELDFDLLFNGENLKHVILYSPHPSASYFEHPTAFQANALRLDAACNFILWLLAKSYNPFSFQQRESVTPFSTRSAAPITQMRLYCAREKAQKGTSQKLLEYDPDFLAWAKKYLETWYRSKEYQDLQMCAYKMLVRPQDGARVPFPFMQLPEELQLMVLSHADLLCDSRISTDGCIEGGLDDGVCRVHCAGSNRVKSHDNRTFCFCEKFSILYSSSCTCSPLGNSSLFLVNKASRAQALEVFYTRNRFQMEGFPVELLEKCERLKRMDKNRLHMIRDLRIYLDDPFEEMDNPDRPLVEALFKIAQIIQNTATLTSYGSSL
ncbi:hypothetical protein BT63DRAFT_454022 [Microthyrium microscopicum]|uniref:Uncharacterized protein n=1 Tax=Microthyrium microscopicum TaxID=703497 RepID=A0A6A6UE65_9PEZI|nr:hypothetical protein BT63DRAFT_454022 [Microthyrium microscopicum]